MKASLTPLFPEGDGDIELVGLLLAIGCDEAPFDSFPVELREQLDERHARVFVDGGSAYVVDLKSTMGTTINGQKVDSDPVEIKSGDEVCFGHDLRFEVNLSEEESALDERTAILAIASQPTLLLLPTSEGQGPSPIAVSQYPFLVSKSSGHFAMYGKQFPQEFTYVSRRHAHMFISAGDLFVEDLGSTNGTLHNGSPLGHKAQKLSSGDTLRFGHELFTFTVQIEASDALDRDSDTSRRVPEETIMISTAGSFLDIYCDTPEEKEMLARALEESSSDLSIKGLQDKAQSTLAGLGQQLVAFWEGLPLGKEVRYGLLGLIGLVVLIGLGSIIFADDRSEDAAALLEGGEYEEALLLAEDFLADNPTDTLALDTSEAALRGYLLPPYSAALDGERANEASSLLEQAKQIAPSQAETSTVALLGWIVDLTDYVASKPAPDVVLLNEKAQPMAALLQTWESNDDRNMRLLEDLARAEPAFDSVRTRVLSNLRALKSDASVLLAPIESLQEDVLRPLNSKNGPAALAALDNFQRAYPRVMGIETWRGDVKHYLTLQESRESGDLTGYIAKRREGIFNTEFFYSLAEKTFPAVDELGPLAKQYDVADRQWQEGDFAGSLNTLSGLVEGQWGAQARDLMAYRQQLLTDFNRLPELYQTDSYQLALLEFYTRIDPERDKFMFDALQTDFKDEQEFASLRAQQLLEAATQSWKDYQSQGGISGALRLESQLSANYQGQAARLNTAYAAAQQAVQIASLLGTSPQASLIELEQAIVAESDRQRSAIKDLQAVLGDATVNEKVALLPSPAEAP